MEKVGVRELKARASEIVAAVEAQGKRYQITKRGKPVAMLVPPPGMPLALDDDDLAHDEAVLADMDVLAREISKRWPKGVSAVEAISANRR